MPEMRDKVVLQQSLDHSKTAAPDESYKKHLTTVYDVTNTPSERRDRNCNPGNARMSYDNFARIPEIKTRCAVRSRDPFPGSTSSGQSQAGCTAGQTCRQHGFATYPDHVDQLIDFFA
jgi:hypothetical protein